MKKMKEVCEEVGITYETLKYYCNEGLVPNHRRDKNNHRIFSDNDIKWIQGLMCLRQCGMSIKDMKKYMELCFAGMDSIKERKAMLDETKNDLEKRLTEIQESLKYIEDKHQYYDNLLEGKVVYRSYLIKE